MVVVGVEVSSNGHKKMCTISLDRIDDVKLFSRDQGAKFSFSVLLVLQANDLSLSYDGFCCWFKSTNLGNRYI